MESIVFALYLIPVLYYRPTNLWNFRGLYVSNIKANESTKQILHDILSEFGKVIHIELIVEREAAIANFDNPESPRIAMSRLQV